MKILSAAQTRELDAYTIQHEPISSLDLMERASRSFVEWFIKQFTTEKSIQIFCGVGNNGGDGLAIGRMLLEQQYHVEVWVIYYSDRTSADFSSNYERLAQLTTIQTIHNSKDIPVIHSQGIVIDAIFGSGLTRPVEGIAAEVIQKINNSESIIVAVDIPSGLYVDSFNGDRNIIQADYTISFQLPKLSFLLPQNSTYAGEWHLTDIGLHTEGIAKAETPYIYTDENLVKKWIKKRDKFSHKGTFGHALLIAGSYGKMGAAVLAARACLHCGVGLLTLHVPLCGYQIMQVSVPEAMTLTDIADKHFTGITDVQKFSAIGIGPGLGTNDETAQALKSLLKQMNKPIVADADALNLLAKDRTLLEMLPPETILTPHPKEFERLAGNTANEYERLQVLQDFSKKNQLVVVLKGAHTAVAKPSGEIYFNSTGNPGMATGGTGDVLTGIITSLLAQNYTPFEAAVLGVYFHGLAGDYAAKEKGYNALIASDLIEHLSEAFKEFGL